MNNVHCKISPISGKSKREITISSVPRRNVYKHTLSITVESNQLRFVAFLLLK